MALDRRYVRVGVFDSRAKRMVADVTLAPGADVVIGSDHGCTVLVPAELGVTRRVLIEGGVSLVFSSGMRLQMAADTGELVMAEADELFAAGTTSPTELKWSRLNVRLSPEVTVFAKYLPFGESSERAPELEPGVELSTSEICLKAAQTLRVRVSERLRLPNGRLPWSQLVGAIRASLSSDGWFPRAPRPLGVAIGEGALLEMRAEEIWVHEQHEISALQYAPVESYRASSLDAAVRAYLDAHGAPPVDGVEIDWEG